MREQTVLKAQNRCSNIISLYLKAETYTYLNMIWIGYVLNPSQEL